MSFKTVRPPQYSTDGFPCQEVRINGQLLEAIDHNDILTCDVSGHYVLIEFPSDDVPLYTQKYVV